MQKIISFILLLLIIGASLYFIGRPRAGNVVTNGAGQTLLFNLTSDNVLHFAWYPKGKESAPKSIVPTEMVFKKDPSTAPRLDEVQDGFEGESLSLHVDRTTLCFTVTDKKRNYEAGQICPSALGEKTAGLTIKAPAMQNIYGLGEQFLTPGAFDGDWIGKVRDSGTDPSENNRGQFFGNNMHGYNGGAVGNATFPVLYAVGSENKNFALFFDNTYKQRWDFTAPEWKVETSGGALQGYLIVGENLPALRREYMDLTGRPPVPPKKAFGLWVSEYGFDNWAELEDKLKTLRANKFPVDGFVLDLQWFGGIKFDQENSPMGGLTWDLKNFPDPAGHIARYKKEEGLGIVLIEEPVISRGVIDPASGKTVHSILEEKGYLATETPDKGSKAAFFAYNPWWGRGGLYDYASKEAGEFWHDFRRQPLVDMGITGHWTDLGEPEAFEPKAFYEAGRSQHADIHNVFNIRWSKSIFDGYARHKVERRPWLLSRSGTSGIQRYGVVMWSGDIGANLTSLTTHLNAQMHMSFSGMDYFGSDIGGFHRPGLQGDKDEMFTQWFAVGSLLDVPVRVHTMNLSNKLETAPDRIGDKASNLFNLRQRYALTPYYYSLAHAAFEKGDAVFAPLVYHFQNDMPARKLGDHKLIGKNLLAVTVSRHGQRQTNVYLPKGTWFDFHSGAVTESTGDWVKDVSVYDGKIFRLPMYALEGTILPMARVTNETQNTSSFGSGDLTVRVYPSRTPSQFTLVEDDGETTAYAKGKVRRTLIEQTETDGEVSVNIGAAQGSFEGGANEGDQYIEIAGKGRKPKSIERNGEKLNEMKSQSELEKAGSGWFAGANGLIVAKVAGARRDQAATWKIALVSN